MVTLRARAGDGGVGASSMSGRGEDSCLISMDTDSSLTKEEMGSVFGKDCWKQDSGGEVAGVGDVEVCVMRRRFVSGLRGVRAEGGLEVTGRVLAA